jgi:hypothetical protein
MAGSEKKSGTERKVTSALLRSRTTLYTEDGVDRLSRFKPPANAVYNFSGAAHLELPVHLAIADYLTSGAKLVYALLRYFARDMSWANPSLDTLCFFTGLSRSAVQNAIEALECYHCIDRVRTPRDVIKLKQVVRHYYEYKQHPDGYGPEIKRLLRRRTGTLRANIYLLRWNTYWDLAWEWQALPPKMKTARKKSPAAGIIRQLVYGRPEDNRAWEAKKQRRGTGGLEHVQTLGSQRGALSAQSVATTPPPQGPATQPPATQTDPEASPGPVVKFWKRVFLDLFGHNKVVTNDEYSAVKKFLKRGWGRGPDHRPYRQSTLEAQLGWYIQLHRKLLHGSQPPEGWYHERSLAEALSDHSWRSFFNALKKLRDATIPDSGGKLPQNDAEIAKSEDRFKAGLTRKGMDSLMNRAPGIVRDYLRKAAEKQGAV